MPAPRLIPSERLGEQYPDLQTQERTLELGMWVFLATEILLFAALFALYASYRTMFPRDFTAAVEHNTLKFGTVNMYVLLTSSLLAALAVSAVRDGRARVAGGLLAGTALLGVAFLAIKLAEYSVHWHEGSLPGPYYTYAELPTFGANRFFTLYWVMTGVHALHVTAGVCVVTWMAGRAWRGFYTPAVHARLVMGTLYWHLVDVIWIFLWPLLYLS
ncbi:MAG: cytochrome c oxidase subunit 3 [Polyangia bacterium]